MEILSVDNGALDSFVADYCAKNGIDCDGDVFGLFFSDKNEYSAIEAEEIIELAAKTYSLRVHG